MKLASFEVGTDIGNATRVGVLSGESTLVDVTAGYAALLESEGEQSPVEMAETTAPPVMVEFLERGDRAMDAAREAREFVADADAERGPEGARLRYDVADVNLLSPVPRPNSIRDFMVVEEHVRNALGDDIPDAWFDMPVYYKGDADCVAGPDEDVEWPAYTEQVDDDRKSARSSGSGVVTSSPREPTRTSRATQITTTSAPATSSSRRQGYTRADQGRGLRRFERVGCMPGHVRRDRHHGSVDDGAA